jgi:hypothetical protein
MRRAHDYRCAVVAVVRHSTRRRAPTEEATVVSTLHPHASGAPPVAVLGVALGAEAAVLVRVLRGLRDERRAS